MIYLVIIVTLLGGSALETVAVTDYLMSREWIDSDSNNTVVMGGFEFYEINPLAAYNGDSVRSGIPLIAEGIKEYPTLEKLAVLVDGAVVYWNNSIREKAGVGKVYAVGYTWKW